MVRVVPGVPDGDITEETVVRPYDLIRPGPHLLSLPLHSPRPPFPAPPFLPRQKVPHHVF